ncbi:MULTISPECIES: hypothetical protein [unclassified Nocardioides]|uniref:hypothetical protein n=1 Tax=unclassified Nocardioides TaxID=2615069 RepID=UPI0007033AA2|nr:MULTISPECIES: hypothetical protein [unclassified Nocardioides]KRC53559.1 hypothetical protein ASE19_14625 [Nocardioides sp. Root79]KRC67965.1 hypothetical protein ASE20_18130 [Nocardioides sp. Root240]
MSAPTRPSRTAAALAAGLALCQFGFVLTGDHPSMTAGVLAPLTLLAALALFRVNCLETRLAVVAAAAAPLLLTSLSATIGLPGQHPHTSVGGVLVGWVLPFAVLVAIDADRRARTRRTAPPLTHPYAR